MFQAAGCHSCSDEFYYIIYSNTVDTAICQIIKTPDCLVKLLISVISLLCISYLEKIRFLNSFGLYSTHKTPTMHCFGESVPRGNSTPSWQRIFQEHNGSYSQTFSSAKSWRSWPGIGVVVCCACSLQKTTTGNVHQ